MQSSNSTGVMYGNFMNKVASLPVVEKQLSSDTWTSLTTGNGLLSHRPFTVDSNVLRQKMLRFLCMGRLFTYLGLCVATTELKLLKNKHKTKLVRVATPANPTSIIAFW